MAKLIILAFTGIMIAHQNFLLNCAAPINGICSKNRKKDPLLHPVIIVPGMGGNQIEARLTSAYKSTGLICRRWFWERTWFTIWFDLSNIIPPFTRCFADRMKLVYDPQKDQYSNVPGVETRVPYFGSTRGMQFLDNGITCVVSYMSLLVKTLEDEGYVDSESLYGAPYDYRDGPDRELTSVSSKFLQNLKKLVEEAYARNQNRAVIFVTHSLGGMWVHHFLNLQTPAWKQQYVKHFVAIATPWAGMVQEVRTFASGYNLGIPTVDPLAVRDEQRSWLTNLWLLPMPEFFGNRTLVTREQKTYNATNMAEFLEDIGFMEGVKPYLTRIRPLTMHLEAPRVPLTVIHGSGVKTPRVLRYGKCGFDQQPQIIEGDGDGTVNLLSLTAVVPQWSATQGQPAVKVIGLQKCSHEGILKDPEAVKVIVKEILNVGSRSQFVELSKK